LNTETNKLHKITRGCGHLEKPGDTNKLEKLQRTTKHDTEQEIAKVHTRQGNTDRNHYKNHVMYLPSCHSKVPGHYFF